MRLDELELAPGAKITVHHHTRTPEETAAVLAHYRDMEGVGRLVAQKHRGTRWYKAERDHLAVIVFLPPKDEEAGE